MDEQDEQGRVRVPTRREPPALRLVKVVAREQISVRMLRLTFEGPGVGDLAVVDPAASVRLLVPSPGSAELVVPVWDGNEFLLPDGERPVLRTFTPLRVDPAGGRLDLEIVRHPGGAVSSWAERAALGDDAAISGPGRGYKIDVEASRFVLIGDETALPAIAQLVEELPENVTIAVDAEVVSERAIISLPPHPALTLTWHVREADARPGTALVDAAMAIGDVVPSTRIWAAGEAASMQAIRKHLFTARGVPRSYASIRGYWKPARHPRQR